MPELTDSITGMTLFDAAVLGTIQGITEFIPVSSSGHLVLGERFLGLSNNFTFDVLLNFGTLLALILFFRKRIWKVIQDIFVRHHYAYAGFLALAILPTALVGFLLSDVIEQHAQRFGVVIVMLLAVGLLMIFFGGEKEHPRITDDRKVTFKDAILVGLAQMAALIPGVSRSGSTILAGLNLGLSYKAAADFSFMMAIPIIFGASMHVLLSSEGTQFVRDYTGAFVVGNLFSFAFGALAVRILITFLKRYGLRPFGWYRVGLAGLLTILLLTGII